MQAMHPVGISGNHMGLQQGCVQGLLQEMLGSVSRMLQAPNSDQVPGPPPSEALALT